MKKLLLLVSVIAVSNNAFAHDENTFNAEYLGQLVGSYESCQVKFSLNQKQSYVESIAYLNANSIVTSNEQNAFDTAFSDTVNDKNSVDCDITEFNLDSSISQAKMLKMKIDKNNSFKGKVDKFIKKYGFKCGSDSIGSQYSCIGGKLYMHGNY